MGSDYPGTFYDFSAMPLAEIRDPVLSGAGHGPIETAVQAYQTYAEVLATATLDLRAALTAAQAAHEGAAADASREHISHMAAAGEIGSAYARLAAGALEEQAVYHVAARNELQAMAVPPEPEPLPAGWGIRADIEAHQAARQHAAEVISRYQDNTNYNLAATFQMFVPPEERPVDVSAWPGTGAPGWGSVGIGAAGVGAAASAGGATGEGLGAAPHGAVAPPGAAVPGAAAPAGVGPGGVGVGSGAVGPGVVGSGVGPGGVGPGGVGSAGVGPGGVGPAGMGPSGVGPNGVGSGGVGPGGVGAGGVGPNGVGPSGVGAGGVGPNGVGPGGAGAGGVGPGGVVAAPAGSASPGASVGASPGAGGRAWGGSPSGDGPGTPGVPPTWPTTDPLIGPGGPGVPGQPGTRTPTVHRLDAEPVPGPGRGPGTVFGAPAPGRDPALHTAPGPRPVGPPGTGSAETGSTRGAGAARPGGTGYGGMPFFPGAPVVRRDEEHRRPPWLVEDDPEAVWFAGLPPHVEPVIGGQPADPR